MVKTKVRTKGRAAGNPLAAYLHGGRVLTSSDLIALLRKTGASEANARQIIGRNSNTEGVWRSENLKLARDERLFAEQRHVGSASFFAAVGERLRNTSRHGLARCVAALATHGVLHRIDVMRLLAVSVESDKPANSRPGPSYSDEVESLRELGVQLVQADTALESLAAPGVAIAEELDGFANLAAEERRYEALLTRILAERLRRQNMLSWNRIDLPDLSRPFTVFNSQLFSGHGFSYLSPLVRWKEGASRPIPCPVLIDCYHGVCTLPQVHSLLQRIERATVRRKKRLPALGVIAARDFDRNAWTAARHEGLLTVSFRQMFGDEALDAMIQVERLLSSLGHESPAKGQDRFKEITQLIEELRMNPVISDLRSIGFEALCGLILQSQGYASPELGRIVPWKETSRDVDVHAVRGDELRVVECKAYHRHKSISGSEVRKFFTETLPALKQWMRKTDRHFKKCTAEIWTTGPIGKDAGDSLYELKRPQGDEWKCRRMSDMQNDIPKAIRERSVKLIETIALAETDEDSP